MSNPPFCPLGSKYFKTSFDSVSGYVLEPTSEINNGQLRAKSGYGFNNAVAFVDNPSELITGPFETSVTVSTYNLETGSVFMTLMADGTPYYSQSVYIDVWSNGDVDFGLYGSGHVTLTNPFTISISSNNDETEIYIKYNGSLIKTVYLAPHPAASLAKRITVRTGYLLTSEMRIDDWYIIHKNLNGSPCQGEIPTEHSVAVPSTAKISHNRILKEERALVGAQQFHNIMKGLA